MRVKVKYLKWDECNLPTEKENLNIFYRMLFAIGGGYTGNENDYIDVNEYTIDEPVDDVVSILEGIFEEHNRIDERFCRLKDDQRSMYIGDLIYLDDKAFTVEPIGFKIVEV